MRINQIQFFSFLILVFICLLLNGCTTDDCDSFHFYGEWTIDSYSLYSQVDGTVVNDLVYDDAGRFGFSRDGSGVATITIPGSSLPPNQPISWSFNSDNSVLSIDYGTEQDAFLYETIIPSQDRVTLIHTVSIRSENSSGFSRTTIKLSRDLKKTMVKRMAALSSQS